MNKKQVYEELEKVGMEVNNMINFDLIKGTIYGGAVGDALGVPVECRTRTDVRNTSFIKIEKELSIAFITSSFLIIIFKPPKL